MTIYELIERRVNELDATATTPRQYLVGGSPLLNNCELADLSHVELKSILTLFTKILDKRITDDHYRVWAWCGAVFWSLRKKSPLAMANDSWMNEFFVLLHLVLARVRNFHWALGGAETFQEVNRHAVVIASPGMAEILASPLAYSLIEGALRRLSSITLDLDGRVKGPLPPSLGNRKRINQIEHAFLIYETNRGVSLGPLTAMKSAIASVLPSFDPSYTGDAIKCISGWRNTTMHGEEFWRDRVPLLVSLICFFVLESLDDSWDDSDKATRRRLVDGFQSTGRSEEPHMLNLFPPDLR